MKKTINSLALVLVLGVVAFGAQAAGDSVYQGHVPDRLLITVTASAHSAVDKATDGVRVGVPALDSLAERFAVTSMKQLYGPTPAKAAGKVGAEIFERVWAVDLADGKDLMAAKAAYEALPEVETVDLVDIFRFSDGFLPDDPSLGSQYYLRNTSLGGADVRAVGGWNQVMGDSSIVVCILDSGVDWHHPDLGGTHPDKVNGAIWTNWTEYYGEPDVDDDGNGYVDDFRGWDFVDGVNGHPDQDNDDEDNDPSDFGGHGTNCSGTTAAITNNGVGISGTAPGCKIMAVRCGFMPNGSEQGVVRMDFAAAGILYAVNNGAKIINCSWGSSSYLNLAVNYAQSNGVLIITAAGNDNTDYDPSIGVPSYLSTRAGVISVAATDSNDDKADFSNYGDWVELSAPGVAIYTTHYNWVNDTSTYVSTQGTSFSSPIACGAAALIWSSRPTWSPAIVTTILEDSCDDLDEANPGYQGLLGAGRINLLRALGDNFHKVPAEFPTAYDAINSSAVGDTVAVEGGYTLGAPLVILDRDLKVYGGYNSDYTSRDPVGNRSNVSGTATTPALRFFGTVSAATEVDGFVLRDGGGQVYSDIPYFAEYGGGLAVYNASPTLCNLEITDNLVGSTSDLGCGGGLMLNNSSSVLRNVYVHDNSAVLGGGAFIFNSTPTFHDCVIENNPAIIDNLGNPARGGGMHILDSDVTMFNCTIDGHTDLEDGGGIYAAGINASSTLVMTGGQVSGNSAKTKGGGIYLNGGAADLRGVQISSNTNLDTSGFMNGGGLYITTATVALDSLVCLDNYANAGGGAVIENCAVADVMHSVFAGNTGQFYGGGIVYQNNVSGSIISNTFTGNEGTFNGGGGLQVTACDPAVENNIAAFNIGSAGAANGMVFNGSSSLLACNDVFGNDGSNYSGITDPTGTDGNISADPEFCNAEEGKFQVEATSPCAAEHSGGCDLIGALKSGCGISPVPDEDQSIPVVFRVDQNFPNPFNPKTTIRFALPAAGHARVTIYDVAGRLVRTLVDESLPAKLHEVQWAGQDDSGRQVSAGVYFYMVTSGDNREVGRMALVK